MPASLFIKTKIRDPEQYAKYVQSVQELASKRAVDALDETILPRRLWCGLDRFDAEDSHTVVESRTEDLVSVVNQEPRFRTVTWERLEHWRSVQAVVGFVVTLK